MERRQARGRSIGLALAAVLALGHGALAQTPVDEAKAWLVAAQAPSGSWGGTYPLIDTATVVEVLAQVDPDLPALGAGITWLAAQAAPNHQELARQIAALARAPGSDALVASLAAGLLAARNPAEPNGALPNWPEGGWGAAPGFASDCTSTALALLALDAAGLVGGISVEDQPIAASATNLHQWTIAPDATKARILITVVGATVRLRMRQGAPPTAGTPFFLLAPGTYLVVYPDSGIPFTPGLNFISLQSTGLAGSYTFSASYETPTLDTRAFAEALDYLQEAQNPDGGWGLARGQATETYASLHALLALQAHPQYDLDPERAAGVAYLQSQQLPGGAFGFDGATPVSYVTALAASSLMRSESYPFGTSIEDAIAALLGLQDPGGSWDLGAYPTALAILALWDHNQPPSADAGPDQALVDADKDGAEPVTLAGSGMDVDGVILAYAWSEGGAPLATGATPTVVLGLGQHDLLLTVTDDGGKSASDPMQVTITGVCDAITGLSCQSVGKDVVLGWTNGDGYASISIYRDGLLIASLPGGATSFTDVDVGTGDYTYTVEGTCPTGAIAAGQDCSLLHTAACSAVSGLACASVEADVVLDWQVGDDYVQIDVLRDGVPLASLPPTATTYTDLSVPSGSYTYTVQGICPQGVSAPGVDCAIDHVNPCVCAPYCSAKTTSLGCAPAIGTLGLPTLGGNDNFVVTVADVVGQTSGWLVWGLDPNPPPLGGAWAHPPLGHSPLGGRSCVFRPRVLASQGSGGTAGLCDGAFAFPVSDAFLAAQGFTPGTTVRFQVWFDDPGHPDGSGVGHSAGLEVDVLP